MGLQAGLGCVGVHWALMLSGEKLNLWPRSEIHYQDAALGTIAISFCAKVVLSAAAAFEARNLERIVDCVSI